MTLLPALHPVQSSRLQAVAGNCPAAQATRSLTEGFARLSGLTTSLASHLLQINALLVLKTSWRPSWLPSVHEVGPQLNQSGWDDTLSALIRACQAVSVPERLADRLAADSQYAGHLCK